MSDNYCVYIVVCADSTFYTGMTNNIRHRLRSHNNGNGSRYTRGRLPVKLIAQSTPMTKSDALKLEYAIKKLPRNRKLEALRVSTLKTDYISSSTSS